MNPCSWTKWAEIELETILISLVHFMHGISVWKIIPLLLEALIIISWRFHDDIVDGY